MGKLFYGDDPAYHYEIDIDNPGHGTILVRYFGQWAEWDRNLSGRELGRLLDELTERALDETPADQARTTSRPTILPAHIDKRTARALLPAFQRAIILAGSGNDKYERMCDEPGYEPEPPLCARCGHGGLDEPEPLTSPWCETYGHHTFGDHGRTWTKATEQYHRYLQWEADNSRGTNP